MKRMHRHYRVRAVAVGVILQVVTLTAATSAAESYKELLYSHVDARMERMKDLYESYRAIVWKSNADETDALNRLAGGEQYRYSFLLGCLSNGWEIRGRDIPLSLAPPAGAWLYSEPKYEGMLQQVSHDVPEFSFDVKSIWLGSSVHAQIFSDEQFSGVPGPLMSKSIPSVDGIRSMKLRTAPRIDYVTVSSFRVSGDHKVSMQLYVSGANLEDAAVIYVGDSASRTNRDVTLDNSAHLHLGQDVEHAGYFMDPAYFGRPIYHYDLLTTELSGRELGDTLKIKVQNPDGQLSNVLAYSIPDCLANLDSDGDGLLDEWETNGYDADGDGVVDVDLKAMGASPLRKDIFVEVDKMILKDVASSNYPRDAIWQPIQDMFGNAPILNPDHTHGVSIHVDYGQADLRANKSVGKVIPGEGGSIVKTTTYLSVGKYTPKKGTYTNALAVKDNSDYFNPAREKIFHYCIFGTRQPLPWLSSGLAGISTFTVTLGGWGTQTIAPEVQQTAFMHELGHTFGLEHGGSQGPLLNWKPNFNSIMNYRFELDGAEVDCNLLTHDHLFSYSEGMRLPLDQNALNEVLGVANHCPVDWNGNGTIDMTPCSGCVRNKQNTIKGKAKHPVLVDSPDWAMLDFDYFHRPRKHK